MSIENWQERRYWQGKTEVFIIIIIIIIIIIYLFLTAIGLTPGGSSTVHIYTQTVHRIQRTEHT
jgi:hypothetical protein